MLFSTLLITACTSVPSSGIWSNALFYGGTNFFTNLQYTRTATRPTTDGLLNFGDCGVTTYQQLDIHPPKLTKQTTRNDQTMDITFVKNTVIQMTNFQVQAKIRPAVGTTFPTFIGNRDATPLISIPDGKNTAVLSLNLYNFLVRNNAPFAWIQVVAYANGKALEKHCYPIQLVGRQ
jgi:hypothetical protein